MFPPEAQCTKLRAVGAHLDVHVELQHVRGIPYPRRARGFDTTLKVYKDLDSFLDIGSYGAEIPWTRYNPTATGRIIWFKFNKGR
ncbi:UNVERIFIED_CONTAM: hypothetical protein K2H54_030821 [Gekko kuhli]